MIALEWMLTAFAVLVLVPTAVLFVQVVAALFGPPKSALHEVNGETAPTPSICVLMPAHDEALGLRATLESLLPRLPANARLLVVADNCVDKTARIAAEAGADVIERFDAARCGKGYALDFGVRFLRNHPPDIVIVVDADCQVAPGALRSIALQTAKTGRPVQALYLMQSPPGASLATRISEFAWLVKNQVRPLGALRLGLPCQLTGSGMAFQWKQISVAPLASSQIVEDLELGLDLARAGAAPMLCPEALVTSTFPVSATGARAQRTRWEHGHLGMIAGGAPKLLLESVSHCKWPLLALAIDLCVPPLALLALLISTALFATTAFFVASQARMPLCVASGAFVMLASAVLMAWFRFARHLISLADLAGIPLYVLSKSTLYINFVRKRQVSWLRATRGRGKS